MDTAEKVGGTILEKSGEAIEKAKNFGSKLFDKAEDMVHKAQEEAEKDTMEETLRQAEEMGKTAEERARDTMNKVEDATDDLLGKHESFFDKAAKYADGDYQMKGNKKGKEGDITIGKNPDFKEKPKSEGKAAGFEDLDGDGDELIDDAIIDE
jgi:vacuolar-type H+-ATPase subunit H